MTYDADSFITRLPTEILLIIFTSLSAKDLTLCRRVCVRFKQIVDGLSRSEALWLKHCRKDYSRVYKIARQKCRSGMLWPHIYRSLSLWPKLSQAREITDEFAAASSVREEIQNFTILRDGIIGVHKKTAIVYYDIETLEKSERCDITGEYLSYAENEDSIVILGFQLHLFIIRKVIQNPKYEANVTFENVKSFILVDREVYYVNVDDEVYVCQLEDEKMKHQLIIHCLEGVLCLSFRDRLQILTYERNIYSAYGQELRYGCSLDPDTNLLHILRRYNLLERMDWRVYIQWMYVLNHTVPEGPLGDIVSVRIYGDTAFVGSNWGVLRIYHAPYLNGKFDLLNSEPVKQYNFMERLDCPVLSLCPIIQIDVLESIDGHTVLVAMPKKIAVLEFTHNSKRPASVAMLPYSEVQKIKMIKTTESQ